MHAEVAAPELTLRGICLGAVITVVFMSANVYLGLKTGITFSASIPAAVMSMGLLRAAGDGGVLENNIVQTQASAAGTLCFVNLVLPGLVLLHYWEAFPIWQTMAICLIGGLLGVAFSVPLRRVMVIDSDLPFPEGVAAAEVLVSSRGTDGAGRLRDLALGSALAGGFGFLTAGLKLLSDRLSGAIVIGHSVFRADLGLSLAIFGIGYLVRLGCGLALLIGIVLAWGIAVPVLTSYAAHSDAMAAAQTLWADKVRLIGAGLIAIAGLWTVASLLGPMVAAIRAGLRGGGRSARVERVCERDLPIAWVGVALVLLCVPTGALLWNFLALAGAKVDLIVFVPALTLVTAVIAFLMATACGYLAGLLGSSSSPISGIGILTVMLVAGGGLAVLPAATPDDTRFIGAVTLFVTSLVITACSIANDNLQDLKAGAIVGATPWKQQVALAIGVVFGSITIAPVLQLLYSTYGFVGAMPRPGMNANHALAVPQAALLTQVADGIANHRLDWTMVAIGGALGIVFVALEALLRRRDFSLPALSVGIGIYLPCSVVLTIALGSVIGWLTERRALSLGGDAPAATRRRGVLISSGFLVGESVVSILIAVTDIARGTSGALAFGGSKASIQAVAAASVFAALVAVFYALITQKSRLRSTT